MPRRGQCGSDYDKTSQVMRDRRNWTFGHFECAIEATAPPYARCGRRIVGYAVDRILKTSLYIYDLDRSARFYEDCLALELIRADERARAHAAVEPHFFCLPAADLCVRSNCQTETFLRTTTADLCTSPFAVAAEAIAEWVGRLEMYDVQINGHAPRLRGGKSIHFRDPDGHLLELATPGLRSKY